MRVVVALGGNALLRRGQALNAENQRKNIRLAAQHLASIHEEHELVIAHGNGPQVGLLALMDAAYTAVDPYPLDVLGAETVAMIGYIIEQELGNLDIANLFLELTDTVTLLDILDQLIRGGPIRLSEHLNMLLDVSFVDGDFFLVGDRINDHHPAKLGFSGLPGFCLHLIFRAFKCISGGAHLHHRVLFNSVHVP